MENKITNSYKAFTPEGERERLEAMLENPNVSDRKKMKIRNHLDTNDYFEENTTVGEMVMGDKRLEGESFKEYKDRLGLQKSLINRYNQGEVLDNPGGGTYVKSIDGEVKSSRREIFEHTAEND